MSEQMRVEVKHINLLRTEITGLQYSDYARQAKSLEVGDELELRHDRANEYDGKAISVFYKGSNIGYISKEDNKILAVLLENKVSLIAYVTEHDRDASIFKGNHRLMAAVYMIYTNLSA